ncbi:MAG: DUF1501 domain-containing protein [Verrucomicrobiota bacterium]
MNPSALHRLASQGAPLSSRRTFLQTMSSGFGWLALNGLFADRSFGSGIQLGMPHHPAKVKRVVWFFMDGGLSHLDSFDYKPKLISENGQPLKLPGKKEDITGKTSADILKSPFEFRPYGKSGKMVSDLFPQIGSCSDDITFLHAVTSPSPDHESAIGFLHSGSLLQGFPSVGAWTQYGLGSESQNLPGFVVMGSRKRQCRTNGFLPPNFQASPFFQSGNSPLDDLALLEKSKLLQANKRQTVREIDRSFLDTVRQNQIIEAAIANHEKAYVMQDAVPEATDLSKESAATLELYGIGPEHKATSDFGRQCLSARRLLERGVRFIEITKGGWDQHSDLEKKHFENALAIDRPIAGLLKDLKSLGMFEDTLIVFASEFGRTPNTEVSKSPGRDHHPWGFTIWMAGGGLRAGESYGRLDDYGYLPVEGAVDIHDVHATILHLLGIQHEKLTYRYSGRDFRLTDVHGKVIRNILA